MGHTRVLFEKCAMKLVTQSISNARIHASNEYLQTFARQQMNAFHNGSDTYLTQEQYASLVKYVRLNFISCLLCFYYF
jgi:hypothetical protein